MLQKGAMDDTATACDDSDPDAIGLCLWTASTLPQAVASRTGVGFGALELDLRRFAHRTRSDYPDLPSPYMLGTHSLEFPLRPRGSSLELRATVITGRATIRWFQS